MIKYKLIGLYELVTGFFGFILICINIASIHEHKENFNTFAAGIALFGVSILAGYTLWKGVKKAVKYSILLQLLQSFSFISNGYQYLFTGGAFVSVAISNNSIRLNSQTTPIEYLIAQVSPLLQTEFKLFILPVIFLLILLFDKLKYLKKSHL